MQDALPNQPDRVVQIREWVSEGPSLSSIAQEVAGYFESEALTQRLIASLTSDLPETITTHTQFVAHCRKEARRLYDEQVISELILDRDFEKARKRLARNGKVAEFPPYKIVGKVAHVQIGKHILRCDKECLPFLKLFPPFYVRQGKLYKYASDGHADRHDFCLHQFWLSLKYGVDCSNMRARSRSSPPDYLDWNSLYCPVIENRAPVSKSRQKEKVEEAMKEHKKSGSQIDPELQRTWEAKLAAEDDVSRDQERFEQSHKELLQDKNGNIIVPRDCCVNPDLLPARSKRVPRDVY